MWHIDYQEWITWPVEEVRAYAAALARIMNLSAKQAKDLLYFMEFECHNYVRPSRPPGPLKISPENEERARFIGLSEDGIFSFNRQMNEPDPIDEKHWEVQHLVRGSGLTSRHFVSHLPIVREEKSAIKKRRKRWSRQPLRNIQSDIFLLCDRALWMANCYRCGYEMWWKPPEVEREPYAGLIWYAETLRRTYKNVLRQLALGDSEAAAWHAMRAGELKAELSIKLAHGKTFEKQQSVLQRQRDAGAASRKTTDEERRAAYLRYRADGHKRIEAGRLAAQELGFASEASIRNAFPGRAYPDDE